MGWTGRTGEENVSDEWRGGGRVDGAEFVCLYCVVGVNVEVDGLREGKVFGLGREEGNDITKDWFGRELRKFLQRRRGRLEHWRREIGVMALWIGI